MTTPTYVDDNNYPALTIAPDSFIYALLNISVENQQPLLTIDEALAAIEQRLNNSITAMSAPAINRGEANVNS